MDQADTADRPIIRPLDPQGDRGKPELPAIVRARSQADCAAGTRFDQEACSCFSLVTTRQFCILPSRQDPISGGPCVGQDRLDEIYEHGLDANCRSPTDFSQPEEPEEEDPPIRVIRVTGPDQCRSGQRFDEDACACSPEVLCAIFCPLPLRNNPLGCGCISQSQYDGIYEHDFTCSAEVTPIVLPPKPDGNEPSGPEIRTLEVKRVSSNDQCTEANQYFRRTACTCYSLRFCRRAEPCPEEAPLNNPIEGFGCGCISQEELDSIFNHGLGNDCLPGEATSRFSLFNTLSSR